MKETSTNLVEMLRENFVVREQLYKNCTILQKLATNQAMRYPFGNLIDGKIEPPRVDRSPVGI